MMAHVVSIVKSQSLCHNSKVAAPPSQGKELPGQLKRKPPGASPQSWLYSESPFLPSSQVSA